MKWQPYPKYKPSGVEWLGEVPEGWDVKRGRFCMDVNPPSSHLRMLLPEDEVSFVPMEAVGEYGGVCLEQTRSISDVGSGYTAFDEGDVVVAKITPCFENGKGTLAVGLVNGAAFGTTELHVLRASSNLDRRFLFYFTISRPFRNTGEGEMYGAGGQKRVPPEFCKDIQFPLPEASEQIAIADFLDRETGKIDTLVAKNRTLIERLKEKRSALISRTVTRGLPPGAARTAGLDPHPELKPSGVEWLGDVPEHWEVKRLGNLAEKIGSGKTPRGGAETYQSEGVLLLRSQNIHDSGLRLSDAVFIDETIDEGMDSTRVHTGDVLLNISRASLGRCSIANAGLPPANVNQHVCIIRVIKSIASPRFVHRSVSSRPLHEQIFSFENGSSREGLNFQQVRSLMLALPPITEQLIIADFLDRETAKIDTLVAKVEITIERLREYRAALITAAVTGKIDVRRAAA